MFILRSTCGRRLLPCIELGRDVGILECSPQQTPFLLCICTNGAIHVWNIYTQKSVLQDSIDSLMAGPPVLDDGGQLRSTNTTIVRARVNATGQPLLTVAIEDRVNDTKHIRSFSYHFEMKCWIRVADDSFIASDFQSMLTSQALDTSRMPMGPMARLQSVSAQSRSTRGLALALLSDLNNVSERNITKTHLENQMASAAALQSVKEYQYWLRMYVQYVSIDEDEQRLVDLFDEFMGPPSGSYVVLINALVKLPVNDIIVDQNAKPNAGRLPSSYVGLLNTGSNLIVCFV